METGMDRRPEPMRFPPLVERLSEETLIRRALRESADCERSAQRASDVLTHMLPEYPVTDGQVDIFLAAKALLYQSLHDAGVAQRKLAKAVQFYLETY